MAQCSECHAEVMVYEHRCPRCGADVRGNEVRPTSERAKVRLCHLVALPGMIFAILPMSWLFALGPLSIIIPWVIRSHPATSPTVRQHLTEVLNFQATVVGFGVLSDGAVGICRDYALAIRMVRRDNHGPVYDLRRGQWRGRQVPRTPACVQVIRPLRPDERDASTRN